MSSRGKRLGTNRRGERLGTSRGGERRWTAADARHLDRAFELAERGRYGVSPNPMVGAVVVRGRRTVAEGHHRRAGGPHAEVTALRTSMSWRITGPLRDAYGWWLRRAKAKKGYGPFSGPGSE